MNNISRLGAAVIAIGGVFGGDANATSVTCSAPPGLRELTVSPGLVGGLCYTQLGNLQVADIAAIGGLGLSLVEKDETPGGSGASSDASGLLGYTAGSGRTSGTWSIASSVWNQYEHIYLGFHFGNGNGDNADNPDSFVIELARADTAGSWSLGGLGAELNGLSHIDLIRQGSCTANPTACDGGGGTTGVPEPATLALVGLGLLAAARSRRRAA